MNTLPEVDLTKIVSGFYRRKGLITAVFLVVCSLATYLAVILPNVYRSSTLILITPQRIPTSYIYSTVTSTIQDRIYTISQQILSRTSLEKIIDEFNLYPLSKLGITMEDRIEKFRKQILIDIRRNDAFQISFESESPEKAMQVATRLAALFIEENLKVREQQAMGTTGFINKETARLREELEAQEAVVNRYKAKYRFELPDQLDANLRTLEQLRRELQGNMARLSSLQERRASLEKQIAEAETIAPEWGRGRESEGGQNSPHWEQVERQKTQLQALLTQYSERHPDVIRLKQEIQALEARTPIQGFRDKGSASTGVASVGNPVRQMLLNQTADLQLQINSLQSSNGDLQRQISSYQARVDNTPVRGIDLSKVSRTYDITLRKYQDLLGKGLESQLSENLEKNQKSEQFQIIDPANFPIKPIRPNRRLILLVGVLAGLAGGFGLAFVLENLDTSFKRSDEPGSYVPIPLLATIPHVTTRGSVLEKRRMQGILILASVGILAIGMICIRLFGALLL